MTTAAGSPHPLRRQHVLGICLCCAGCLEHEQHHPRFYVRLSCASCLDHEQKHPRLDAGRRRELTQQHQWPGRGVHFAGAIVSIHLSAALPGCVRSLTAPLPGGSIKTSAVSDGEKKEDLRKTELDTAPERKNAAHYRPRRLRCRPCFRSLTAALPGRSRETTAASDREQQEDRKLCSFISSAAQGTSYLHLLPSPFLSSITPRTDTADSCPPYPTIAPPNTAPGPLPRSVDRASCSA